MHRCLPGLVVVAAALAVSPAPRAEVQVTSAPSSRPLETGVMDGYSFAGPEAERAYERLGPTGARFVRVAVLWSQVAPRAAGPSFDARNPGDPLYRWALVDKQVTGAVANGFTPIVSVHSAPIWAQRCSQGPGSCRPDPKAFADFMSAAALRYRGNSPGLPRVRHWQIWNEPNLSHFLMPQLDAARRPLSPDVYRPLVNAAADAIHAVRRDNVVIAGGTSSFGQVEAVSPLVFTQKLLCVSGGPRPKPVCRKRIRFDIWSHHPYTSGSPTHRAEATDDVSLPDLWRVKALLDAAVRAGNVQSRGPVDFWVTEFGWDTSPPDPEGIPERLHARWVSEALYRAWSQGATLVTWFLLRDQQWGAGPYQSGLYFRGPDGIASDKPKLSLTAFRFPFVAFREPKRRAVKYWGRSPAGRAVVVVERKVADGWKLVRLVRPNRHGIFAGSYPSTARTGFVRARLANGKDAAVPFSLVVPPDRPGCVWGTC